MLIHRGALLAGAVAAALAGGCKYDLDKLKGAEVADASGGIGGRWRWWHAVVLLMTAGGWTHRR